MGGRRGGVSGGRRDGHCAGGGALSQRELHDDDDRDRLRGAGDADAEMAPRAGVRAFLGAMLMAFIPGARVEIFGVLWVVTLTGVGFGAAAGGAD